MATTSVRKECRTCVRDADWSQSTCLIPRQEDRIRQSLNQVNWQVSESDHQSKSQEMTMLEKYNSRTWVTFWQIVSEELQLKQLHWLQMSSLCSPSETQRRCSRGKGVRAGADWQPQARLINAKPRVKMSMRAVFCRMLCLQMRPSVLRHKWHWSYF